MLEVVEVAKNLLLYISPLAVIAFSILTAWGAVKGMRKLGASIKGLSESPGGIILAVLLSAAGLYFLYSFIWPILQ